MAGEGVIRGDTTTLRAAAQAVVDTASCLTPQTAPDGTVLPCGQCSVCKLRSVLIREGHLQRRVFYILHTPTNGNQPATVRAPLRAVNEIAFERHFHTSVSKGLDNEAPEQTSHLYWLAYQCEGKVTPGLPPFDDWVETLDTIDLENETVPFGDPPPTPPPAMP
jgi:hypothetical protein